MLPPMRHSRRSVASLILFLATAIGAGEQVAAHAHPIDENDLVPHSLSLIRPGPECGGSAHYDSGRSADHPVCAECALAACAVSVAAGRLAVLIDESSSACTAALEEAQVLTSSRRLAGARAPPLS